MKLKPFTPRRFRRRVFSQLWMLALQFLLGMVLNLLGTETKGATHTAYNVVLVAHILNAIGLLEGTLYIAFKAPSRIVWWATAATATALGAGILTARTGQEAWSFVMACGFLTSTWMHGVLYLQADRLVSHP